MFLFLVANILNIGYVYNFIPYPWIWYIMITTIGTFTCSIFENILIIKWVNYFSSLIKNKKLTLKVFKATVWRGGR